MAKYSFHSKLSKEGIKIINANNSKEAISFFAKLKKFSEVKFCELYEVVEK